MKSLKINRSNLKATLLGSLFAYYTVVLTITFQRFSPRLAGYIGFPIKGISNLLQWIGPGDMNPWSITQLSSNYGTIIMVIIGGYLGYTIQRYLSRESKRKERSHWYALGLVALTLLLFLGQTFYVARQTRELVGDSQVSISGFGVWQMDLVPQDPLYNQLSGLIRETLREDHRVSPVQESLGRQQGYAFSFQWPGMPMLKYRFLNGFLHPQDGTLLIDGKREYRGEDVVTLFNNLEEEIYMFQDLREVRIWGDNLYLDLNQEQLGRLEADITDVDGELLADNSLLEQVVQSILSDTHRYWLDKEGFYQVRIVLDLPQASSPVQLTGTYHEPTGILVFDENHVYSIHLDLKQ